MAETLWQTYHGIQQNQHIRLAGQNNNSAVEKAIEIWHTQHNDQPPWCIV